MAAEKCTSGLFELDMFTPGGGHWGPSTDYLMALEADALARALGASINSNPSLDSTPSSSSMSSHFFPCSPSPTGSTSTFTPASSAPGSPFLPSRPSSAPASRTSTPPPDRPQPGAVATGRISKRKPRTPSKRNQIAYIEVDPDSFRDMVQQMTGFGKPPLPELPRDQPPSMPMMMQRSETQQFLLPQQPMPTLDTSAGFMDTVPINSPQQQQQILSGTGLLDDSLSELDDLLSTTMTTTYPEIQQTQPLPPYFPTLESWSC